MPRGERFSVRLEQHLGYDRGGALTLDLIAAGGARLWVGDALWVDRWEDDAVETTVRVELPPTGARVRLEYVSGDDAAALDLTWRLDPPPGAMLPVVWR
jgi:hypothetical protein